MYMCQYLVYIFSWLIIQWNLYEATNQFCGLSEQVVFHHRQNKNDFVKSVPDAW